MIPPGVTAHTHKRVKDITGGNRGGSRLQSARVQSALCKPSSASSLLHSATSVNHARMSARDGTVGCLGIGGVPCTVRAHVTAPREKIRSDIDACASVLRLTCAHSRSLARTQRTRARAVHKPGHFLGMHKRILLSVRTRVLCDVKQRMHYGICVVCRNICAHVARCACALTKYARVMRWVYAMYYVHQFCVCARRVVGV